MVNLKETAKEYVPKTTLLISDLKEVSIDCEVLDGEYIDENPIKSFKYKYILIDDVEYRVPLSVIAQLQILIEDEQTKDIKTFKVIKTGENLKTKYQVVKLS